VPAPFVYFVAKRIPLFCLSGRQALSIVVGVQGLASTRSRLHNLLLFVELYYSVRFPHPVLMLSRLRCSLSCGCLLSDRQRAD
jgi:hypothetical protein